MTPSTTPTRRWWIVSPWFDLLFVINVWWVLALLPATPLVGVTQSSALELWQVYFITTPHRWITLLLVATDPDRREGCESWFIPLAVIFGLLVVIVGFGMGRLDCLIAFDFIWNAWHFASQHGGILRIYGRMGGGGNPVFERWGFRVFVTYTALRTADWLTGWTETVPQASNWLATTDMLILIPPAGLVAWELINRPRERLGKVLYMTSVVAMYGVILFAIRQSNHQLMIMMAMATSAFHSVEYMAILTHYAWRRQTTGSPRGAFRVMARHWVQLMLAYMMTMGILLYGLERNDVLRDVVIGANLWAALLHYAYDGMIWKLRRPQTAQALNA